MTETITSRRRLGRGLEALLGPTREEAQREGSLVELAIADIRRNPFQPRRDVDPAQLDELTASIRKAGLLQPVVVRQAPGGSGGVGPIPRARRARAPPPPPGGQNPPAGDPGAGPPRARTP